MEHVVTCDANRLTDIREHAIGPTLAQRPAATEFANLRVEHFTDKDPARDKPQDGTSPAPLPFENERRRHRLSLPGSSRKPLAPEEHVGGYTLPKHHPYPNRRIGSIPVRQCVLSISQHMNRPRYLKREKRAWPWLGTRY